MKLIAHIGYRVDPDRGTVYGFKGKPIRKLSSGGYIQANRKKPKFTMAAHRIVWESVHGPIPPNLQINHINGIKTDNRIANLELVTPSENTLHAYRIGLRRADGEFNGRAIGKRRSS